MEANYNEPSIIRMSAVVFGALFKNIKIRQYNSKGKLLPEPWIVPIVYSNKQAYDLYAAELIRTPSAQIPEFGRRFPRMAFSFTGMSFDSNRQLSPWLKSGVYKDKLGKHLSATSPVAYIFNYDLGIYCKDIDTFIQIADQIVPYFKPEVSVKLKEQRSLPIINDVKIELASISMDDNYQDGLDTNRLITSLFNFNMYLNYWAKPSLEPSILDVAIDLNDALTSDEYNFFNLPKNKVSEPTITRKKNTNE